MAIPVPEDQPPFNLLEYQDMFHEDPPWPGLFGGFKFVFIDLCGHNFVPTKGERASPVPAWMAVRGDEVQVVRRLIIVVEAFIRAGG